MVNYFLETRTLKGVLTRERISLRHIATFMNKSGNQAQLSVSPAWTLQVVLALFSFWIALGSGAPIARADSPEVLTAISPDEGSIDDQFTFTVTVNNDMTGAPPMLNGGEDFTLRLIGPQSSVRIVNGEVSSSIMYIYQLRPKRVGELMTPSAEVEIGGQKLAAPALKVKVGKSDTSGVGNAPSNNDKAFLRQVASPTSVYQGQQLVASVTLYTRVPLREISIHDESFDDFWQEPFGPEQRSTKNINGNDFTAVQLKRALYPLKVGKLTLPVRTMDAVMRGGGRSSWPFGAMDDLDEDFGGFFGSPGKKVTLKSEPVDIEVKPLPPPPPGLPSDWVPVVGPTSLKLRYSPDSVKVGSGKTVEVQVASEGNLNPLKALQVQAGPDVRIYDEKPEVQHDTRSTVLVNHKTFRYSLVPLRPGLLRIPPITLTYFDPELGKYATATTPPIAFPAEGTPAPDVSTSESAPVSATSSSTSGTGRFAPIPTLAPVELSDSPISPYQEPTFLQRIGNRIPLSVAILIGVAVLLILVLCWAFAVWRARIKPRKIDLSSVRNARDVRELNDAVRTFLSQRFGIGGNHLTSDELRQALAQKGFPPEFTFEVGSLLDEFDLLLYSGSAAGDKAVLENLRERANVLVRRTI